MRICILDLDTPPPELADEHGTFASMFVDWLGPAMPEARFTPVVVETGHEVPQAGEYDGFLITGSRHGVYDELPWMAHVARLIRDASDARVPVTGVCFGHQLLAETYGGRVVKSPGGWVLGNMDYRASEAGVRMFGDARVEALAMHQDQVVEAPPAAEILLGNDQCPIAALEYDGPALSVQFHPEFTRAFMFGLMETFGGERVPMKQLQQAMENLKAAPSRDKVAQTFASFYRRWGGST